MRYRVLLIDDSEADRLYTRIMLERAPTGRAGIEVLEHESAREALADLAAAKLEVDLILLDLNMPGMNGFEFLEGYKALGLCPSPPSGAADGAAVVMLTSSPDPADRQRALAYACVRAYATKPIDLLSAEGLLQHAPQARQGGA